MCAEKAIHKFLNFKLIFVRRNNYDSYLINSSEERGEREEKAGRNNIHTACTHAMRIILDVFLSFTVIFFIMIFSVSSSKRCEHQCARAHTKERRKAKFIEFWLFLTCQGDNERER